MKKFLIVLFSFVLVFTLVIPASADNSYGIPTISDIWDEEVREVFPYAFIWDTGTEYLLYLCSTIPYGVHTSNNTSGIRIRVDEHPTAEYTYEVWKLYSGEIWEVRNVSKNGFYLDDELNGRLLWTSSAIFLYDGEGGLIMDYDENFFPMTFPEVMQASIRRMKEMTLGTMMTLTLCGVGLLASVIVLTLFSKRSLIPRNL